MYGGSGRSSRRTRPVRPAWSRSGVLVTGGSRPMTRDQIEIVLIATAWSAGVGVVGLLVAYLTRRRSFRWSMTLIALVAVIAVVAGVLGTATAMFLSGHD